jgi:hypothetical protein
MNILGTFVSFLPERHRRFVERETRNADILDIPHIEILHNSSAHTHVTTYARVSEERGKRAHRMNAEKIGRSLLGRFFLGFRPRRLFSIIIGRRRVRRRPAYLRGYILIILISFVEPAKILTIHTAAFRRGCVHASRSVGVRVRTSGRVCVCERVFT